MLAVLYALPVLELVVLILLGRRIGPVPVVLMVLASTMLGLSVLRRAGSGALHDLAATRDRLTSGAGPTIDPSGRPVGPSRPAADRLLLAFAGILLVIPGLIGSGLGLLLLIPGLRHLVRAVVLRVAGRRGWVSGPAQVHVISVDPITPDRVDPNAEVRRFGAE